MPTGWRPADVSKDYPIKKLSNVQNQKKYDTENSFFLIVFCWIQLIFTLGFMFHMFLVLHQNDISYNYLYAIFIFIGIFAYTSLLDQSSYAFFAEVMRFIFGLWILQSQNFSWFNINGISIFLFLIISLFTSAYFHFHSQKPFKLSLVKK